MSLSQSEVDELLQLIRLTKDEEIDCGGCLDKIAAFADRELAGKSVPKSLEAISDHLAICPECREEYEALQKALDSLEG